MCMCSCCILLFVNTDKVLVCEGCAKIVTCRCRYRIHFVTHTFNGPFPGLPRSAGTRKVKPIWILLEQETVSGSGISWAICKSAPRSRQITMSVLHHSKFFTGRMPFLPPNQQRQSTEGTQIGIHRQKTSLCSATYVR